MCLRRLLIPAVCVLSSLVAPVPAEAWNSPGHIIIALIAYDQMDPATRAKAVELLRAHPRFSEHFQSGMPREISRGEQRGKDEWVFAHAATWPDQVRDAKGGVNHQDVSEFNRPWWHFIDEPVFLNDEERKELEGEIRVNRRRDPPQDSDDVNMNVVQALKNSARMVGDKTAPREKRSVHLCWLLHLTGDAHQPLHAVALFTTHRFRGGDHGGNYLEFEHKWDLHAFWDEQVSTDEPYETLRILATDLGRNRRLRAAGQKAAGSLDPGKWIDESQALAMQYAYTPEVLKKVSDREGHSRLGPLDLSAKYRADAQELAERRAMEAGSRLAKSIEQLLQ
jgi:S1/P1 Nuclease